MAIKTFSEAVDSTIAEEMRRDPTIFHITGISLGSRNSIEEFGWKRIAYAGICETQIAGSGVGAALAGTRPIVSLGMTDFAVDGWGQIVLQAAKIHFKLGYRADCPAVFTMGFGAVPGGSLSVHHTGSFHNWLANAPGLLVAVPSMPADAQGLWRTALRTTKDPVCMLTASGVAGVKGPVPDDNSTMIPFGKAEIKREGADVTIAAVGYMVHLALEAAEDLAKEGIDAEVWDPRTLTPFDRESLINSVYKTGAMVVVDHAPESFGTTGEFAITVAEAITPAPPVARVASKDTPVPASPALEPYLYPNKDKVMNAVYDVLERKNGAGDLGIQKN